MSERTLNILLFLLLIGIAGCVIAFFPSMRSAVSMELFFRIFIIVGSLLVLFISRYYFLRAFRKKIETVKNINQFIKSKGRRIKVDLDEIEVLSNKWGRMEIAKGNYYTLLDRWDIAYDPNEVENKSYVETAIRYDFSDKGSPRTLCMNIRKDEKTILMKFAIQKETNLYILDNQIYLDLEFLYI